jgi:hypothetical protein
LGSPFPLPLPPSSPLNYGWGSKYKSQSECEFNRQKKEPGQGCQLTP